MSVSLYIGVGPYPIHQQHIDVMDKLGGDWIYIDKFVVQEGTLNYDAFDLPYSDVHAIYNSHLLEHISHRKVKRLIEYWHSLLKVGGKIYINVPDLEWACKNFLEILEKERKGEVVYGYYNSTIDPDNYEHDFLQIFYGSHEHEGEYHKCGYTKESLEKLLKDTGFTNITIKQEFEAHDIGCLIAEAEKC